MLFWCYVCPPLACILMGRPFSAMLASVLCLFFWIPGVNYALVTYVDYKGGKHVGTLAGAIRGQGQSKRTRAKAAEPELINNPRVGMGGTRFKRK